MNSLFWFIDKAQAKHEKANPKAKELEISLPNFFFKKQLLIFKESLIFIFPFFKLLSVTFPISILFFLISLRFPFLNSRTTSPYSKANSLL